MTSWVMKLVVITIFWKVMAWRAQAVIVLFFSFTPPFVRLLKRPVFFTPGTIYFQFGEALNQFSCIPRTFRAKQNKYEWITVSSKTTWLSKPENMKAINGCSTAADGTTFQLNWIVLSSWYMKNIKGIVRSYHNISKKFSYYDVS